MLKLKNRISGQNVDFDLKLSPLIMMKIKIEIDAWRGDSDDDVDVKP